MMEKDKEEFSEGYVKIIIEGTITGHSISPIRIVIEEQISPKMRDKINAKWRLEQSVKNALQKALKQLEPEKKPEPSKSATSIQPIDGESLERAFGD